MCGEWASDHRLLGEIINPHAWHGVFTAMGRALKPSDAEVHVPAQRQPTKKVLDTPRRRR